VRSRIEALLSLGIANSPMAGARIRVSSGNFITAKPQGVIDGIDMELTGEVRRVDTDAIHQRLEDGDIVLISPLGYSPTGEIYNLALEEVATQVAVRIDADKLIFLMETEGVRNGRRRLLTELSTRDAEALLEAGRAKLPPDVQLYLPCAIRACNNGVKRAHLISRHVDGALLLELFTRDGIGTMVAAAALAHIRNATIDDVGGILQIIKPLEEQGSSCAARASGSRWRSSASSSPSTTTRSSGALDFTRFSTRRSASSPRSRCTRIFGARVTARR
jgi:amino-acid N-acetyltransferase